MVVENKESRNLEFADPGALLILVVAFMLYSLGFIDLLGHTSGTPMVFGQYSIPFFILLALYPLGFIILGVAFFSKTSLDRLRAGIAWFQKSNAKAALALALAFISGLLIFWDIDRWRNYPILRLNLLILLLIGSAVLLFSRWRQAGNSQAWRKVALTIIIGFLALEGALQALAWSGNLPAFVNRIDSPFVSYGRVYNAGEQLTNGLRNRNGLYYPEFRFDPGASRILITGDTFVQALEIEPEQNLGARLDAMLAADASSSPREVFALGLPHYGPGLYLDVPLFPFTLNYFEPQEVLILFSLGHDFQPLLDPQPHQPRYILDDRGQARVHPGSRGTTLHTTQHNVLHAYEPVQPVLVIRSHLMTPKVARALIDHLAGRSAADAFASQLDRDGGVGANAVVFEQVPSEQQARAFQLAFGLLDQFYGFANFEGLAVRLVTIPTFSSAFYESYSGEDWTPEIGKYDLFLPEREMQAFAEEREIAFLPMGQYMHATGMTARQIQELYYENGLGSLTPAGHEYFAAAVYECFYDPSGARPALQARGLCN